MKVLHLVGHLGIGGDSSVIFAVMSSLKEEDIEFGFITHEGYDPNVVKQLRSKGIDIYILQGDVRQLGAVKYYTEIKSLLRRLKSQSKCDFLHVHTALQSGIALAAAKHVGISHRICHAHTTNILRGASRLQLMTVVPLLSWCVNHYSTCRVACGKAAGRFLFGTSRDFHIIYNGIDMQAYRGVTKAHVASLKNELGINSNQIVVGHVGRFVDVKNQSYILKLAEITDERYVFVMVGEGETFERIKSSISKYSGRVILPGKRSDIPVFMRMFDCLLLPSLGEGFALAIIEAQAAGCKCIASTHVPEESDLGLGLVEYVSLSDIEQWKSKIEVISAHQSFEQRNSYASSVEDAGFDSSQSYKKWIEIYRGCIQYGRKNGEYN